MTKTEGRVQRRSTSGATAAGDRIRAARFKDRLRGYDPDQVDPFLERLAEAVDEQRPVEKTEVVPKFDLRFRGYDPAQVDALIADVQSSRRASPMD